MIRILISDTAPRAVITQSRMCAIASQTKHRVIVSEIDNKVPFDRTIVSWFEVLVKWAQGSLTEWKG